MESAQLTRRVNIDFRTPAPVERQVVTGGTTTIGVVGGTPGGVLGGIVGGVPSGVPGGTASSTQRSVAWAITQEPLAGKTLNRILVSGLSEQSTKDLLARLPYKEGDVLSDDSFDRIVKAAREYDEHLNVGRMLGRGEANNSTAAIMISAPGGGGIGMSSPAVAPPAPGTERITVGGNVQQAKLVRQPRPEYPPLAKQARISGVVRLQVVIAEDGSVKDIALMSGHPLLVPPSMEAVRRWRYEPTLLNGKPVEVLTQVDVNFTLSDQLPPQ
jgi:TonB family protein